MAPIFVFTELRDIGFFLCLPAAEQPAAHATLRGRQLRNR
jgi:hypothetical protein